MSKVRIGYAAMAVLAAILAMACERSSSVSVVNNSQVEITVSIDDRGRPFQPGETGTAYGPLNKEFREIRVLSRDGEEFVLRFPDGTNQDYDVVVEGPPLRVVVETD